MHTRVCTQTHTYTHTHTHTYTQVRRDAVQRGSLGHNGTPDEQNREMDGVHRDLAAIEKFILGRSKLSVQADLSIEAADASILTQDPMNAIQTFFRSDEVICWVVCLCLCIAHVCVCVQHTYMVFLGVETVILCDFAVIDCACMCEHMCYLSPCMYVCMYVCVCACMYSLTVLAELG
jgi:hypothetical protein